MKKTITLFFIIFFLTLFPTKSDAKEKFMCLKPKGSNINWWVGPSGLATTTNCIYKISKDKNLKSYTKLLKFYNNAGGGSVRNINIHKIIELTKKDDLFINYT